MCGVIRRQTVFPRTLSTASLTLIPARILCSVLVSLVAMSPCSLFGRTSISASLSSMPTGEILLLSDRGEMLGITATPMNAFPAIAGFRIVTGVVHDKAVCDLAFEQLVGNDVYLSPALECIMHLPVSATVNHSTPEPTLRYRVDDQFPHESFSNRAILPSILAVNANTFGDLDRGGFRGHGLNSQQTTLPAQLNILLLSLSTQVLGITTAVNAATVLNDLSLGNRPAIYLPRDVMRESYASVLSHQATIAIVVCATREEPTSGFFPDKYLFAEAVDERSFKMVCSQRDSPVLRWSGPRRIASSVVARFSHFTASQAVTA